MLCWFQCHLIKITLATTVNCGKKPLFSFLPSFLGSGPEGADDLCFHICRNFSSFFFFFFVPPPQIPGPYLSLKTQIPAWRLKSQPGGSNSSLEAQIPAWRLKFQPRGSNSNLEAQIPASPM